MSWERDPLLAKARLFFQQAFDQSRDDPVFGLWCSFGLELLARAALASISPTLLAEPDRDHKYLLHALQHGSERVARKSILSIQVFSLCRTLFPDFTDEDYKAAMALINRRNEELHSGGAAFNEYQPNQWLTGFYHACKSLCSVLNESLESLFGEDEATVANEVLKENRNDVRQRVQSEIASYRTVFEDKSEKERKIIAAKAEKEGLELSTQRHHRVTCPACKCIALIRGKTFGKEHVTHHQGEIIVRQTVAPNSFICSACGLKLNGYAELEEAGLGGHYQRKTTYSPEEYYGLIHPDNLGEYIEDYLSNLGPEYDNE